jgi:hypothetical protein
LTSRSRWRRRSCAARGPPVIAVAAVGAVEPHLKERTVVREQFAKLVAVIRDIGRRAVIGAIAIPRREIHAELQTVLAARCGKLRDDIAVAALPGTVLHGVFCVGARPQAEAVVMLRGEDETLHAGVVRDARPLPRIERVGVERALVFAPVAPFLVGERVHAEVQEAIELEFFRRELTT